MIAFDIHKHVEIDFWFWTELDGGGCSMFGWKNE